MVNSTTISFESLKGAVHDMVKANIDDNLEALDATLHTAGKKAEEHLQVHAIDGMSHSAKMGMSHRTKYSLSRTLMDYRSGWHAYHYRGIFYNPDKYKSVLVIVGNAHSPTLSHLMEFGYVHVGGERFDGNKQIEAAYEAAAPIARGGKVT